MKICDFNNVYLTPLLVKIFQEEKTCLLMGDFNISLLNTDTNPDVSDFYDSLSSKQGWQKTLKPSLIIFL